MFHEEEIEYTVDGKKFIGYLVAPKESKKRPGIVVAHAWKGRDPFAIQKAKELAQLGYVGFAADVYGDGIAVQTNEEASKLMAPLFLDRPLLLKRIQGAYEALKKHSQVDSNQMGGIGFCFGGLTIIELLKSGVDVKGVVSFHGSLSNKAGDRPAKILPIAKDVKGALLLLHGYEDPFVSQEDLLRFQKEMNDANVDWQLNIYGHAVHAFTNPAEHDKKRGLAYDQKASDRSWNAMTEFFSEIFK